MDKIQYNYPVERLDELVSLIYDKGMTPMMTPDLKAEVELRYQEMCHMYDDDDEDDEAFMTAKQQHEAAMKNIEKERRRSHSRNVIILDLTEEEQAELTEGMESSYVRPDPNAAYNLSDEDISSDETRRRIYKQLQSLGRAYYHQSDFRNAMKIIQEAIEYSLKNDYPWLTYEEACKQFQEGKIKYTFAQLPILYIDYNTQISDPKVLAGIVSGEINLIDKDAEPVKKKKQKANPVPMEYSIIGPAEHAEMVKIHQAGYNTDISTILKSCSTIYNRYVIPPTFAASMGGKDQPQIVVDWSQPGAGAQYFDDVHGNKRNSVTDIMALLNQQNDRKLNHVIGNNMRGFIANWNNTPKTVSFKTISTSLEQYDEAVKIENKLLDLMRQSNPGL